MKPRMNSGWNIGVCILSSLSFEICDRNVGVGVNIYLFVCVLTATTVYTLVLDSIQGISMVWGRYGQAVDLVSLTLTLGRD
jgi:hypothetical protein